MVRRSSLQRFTPLQPSGFHRRSVKLGDGSTDLRRALPFRTAKRKGQERIYGVLRNEFLAANPGCERCGWPATLVHHKAGRRGALLLDVDLFAALCDPCHQWVHAHVAEARELGLMVSRVAL